MNTYKVEFYYPHDTEKLIQIEEVEAKDEAQVRRMYEGLQVEMITPVDRDSVDQWLSLFESGMREKYGANWESDADKLRFVLENPEAALKSAPLTLNHPVQEAYDTERTHKCEKCQEGKQPYSLTFPNIQLTCVCCSGNWRDCPNCAEATTSDIAIQAARYNFLIATPENKAWAEKRLQEELSKAGRRTESEARM